MKAASLLAVLLIACGDDDASLPDAGPPAEDAGPADAGPGDAGPPLRRDAGMREPPPPSDDPYHGPWVLQTELDRAVVRWETYGEAPATVAIEVTAEDGGETLTFEGTSRADEVEFSYGVDIFLVDMPDFPGTYHFNEVVADGLAPATCYEYSLVGWPDVGGRFCTMHEPTDHETPIRFLFLADTSPVLETTQRVVEATMDSNPELILHGGDLQYYDTLLETWHLWFQECAPLLRQGAFYPVIGNHEDEQPGEYEATYARWFENPSRDGDTNRYHLTSGGVHFFGVNSEDDIGEFDEDFSWLDDALAVAETEPGFRFSVVYFHRPIYTLARHAPSMSLRAALEPIIESHTVPLVLQGHNHVYERFEVGTTTYLVAGGGGSATYDVDAQLEAFPEEVPLRVESGRFHQGVVGTITESEVHLEVIDADGVSRDDFRIALPFSRE